MSHSDSNPDSPRLPDLGTLSTPGSVLPTPEALYERLGRRVIGQDLARRTVATAAYAHCLGVAAVREEGGRRPGFGPRHTLLLGPTGCGKSLIARCLAEELGLPYLYVNAADLVEGGYKGLHVETLFQELYLRCEKEVPLAERALVFVDELDKCRRSSGLERDVSGAGAQNALLALLDGAPVTVGTDQEPVRLETSQMLFLCAGAFVGLEDVVRRRMDTAPRVGFQPRNGAEGKETEENVLSQVHPQDLVEYGLIPELVGRLSAVAVLAPLSRADLVRILLESEDSALRQTQAYARLHGIDLEVAPAALEAVAERAHARGTGARALDQELRKDLLDIETQMPTLAAHGPCRMIVDDACLRGEALPLIEALDPAAVGAELHNRATELLPDCLPGMNPAAIGRYMAPSAREGISQTRGWSRERIEQRLAAVRERLDWSHTTEAACKWWLAFEKENKDRPALILRLAEELLVRKATITEFFLSYVYSNTDNIQANLYYMDYTRLKRRDEEQKRRARAAAAAARAEREVEAMEEAEDPGEDSSDDEGLHDDVPF